jgi:hypothetical protein
VSALTQPVFPPTEREHGLFARPHKLQLIEGVGASAATAGAARVASFKRLLPAGMPPSAASAAAADSKAAAMASAREWTSMDGSMYSERQVPVGWAQAWLGSGADAVPDTQPLPVTVYVSSLGGDRRAAKNSRWAIDFLTAKKVPHGVVDLSVQPKHRSKLLAKLAEQCPPSTDGVAEDPLANLPVIDFSSHRMLSVGEMQVRHTARNS